MEVLNSYKRLIRREKYISGKQNKLTDLFLVKQIEDIDRTCTLKPFDKVLVRDIDTDIWDPAFFSRYIKTSAYPYQSFNNMYKQCIPYNNETKDLLRTTGNAPEKYKTW